MYSRIFYLSPRSVEASFASGATGASRVYGLERRDSIIQGGIVLFVESIITSGTGVCDGDWRQIRAIVAKRELGQETFHG